MPDEATANCIWSSIATFLGGSFVGTWLGHFLAIGRDVRNQKHAEKIAKEERKRDFLGFIDGFRSEAESTHAVIFGKGFRLKIHQLRVEAAKIKTDLPGDQLARFDTEVTTLCRITDAQASEVGDGGKHLGIYRVTEAIDRIVATLQ